MSLLRLVMGTHTQERKGKAMPYFNAIENKLGQLWCRKSNTWIEPENFSEYALRVRCEYPTFAGCNQVALRLHKRANYNFTHWPKQWGRIHVRSKEFYGRASV